MGAFVTSLLVEARRYGVEVAVIGGTVCVRPADHLPTHLRERLRAHKAEVLAALAPPIVAAKLTECRHCEGKGECDCPACTLRRTERPSPCLMCEPARRQIWLAASRKEGCWHCGGSGKCGCVGCGRPGVCLACTGSGQGRPQ